MIPGTENVNLDLTRSFVYIKAKITNAADGNNADRVQIGPINLPLHSMFSNVEVELCGKTVSDPNDLYAYRAYIEKLLSYSKEVQESQLQSAGWYKDTGGKMDITDSVGNGATNAGLKSRAAMFSAGAEVELTGRLHCDLFHQPKAIPQKCGMKIKLTPSKDAFMLMTGAGVDNDHPQVLHKFKIMDARLFIRELQVSSALVLAHQKVLADTNMRFPIRRVEMKHLTIAQGQRSIAHDNIFMGQLPRRIAIGMVSDSSMSGHYQQNPFNFQHFDLNNIVLYVDAEADPKKANEPNFTTKQYLRDYLAMFQGTDTMFSNRSINISRTDFAEG